MRKTKIICTLGPSSANEKTITDMIQSGMDVARLNFSHGSHEYHKENIELIKKVRTKLKAPVAILLDTKGPEIRLCNFKNSKINLEKGQKFTLTSKDIEGDENRVSITYKDLPKELEKGNTVLIDDGKVRLTVEETTDTDIICTVKIGGEISNHKGVNIPNVPLDMEYISPSDEEDIIFGIENDVDFIAASFVRRKEDIIALRKFVDYRGGHTIKLISKIENIEGIQNFDEILKYSDGIMIARGDMGVEVEFERLPGLQKKFIKKCYLSGKMVITATQMLESMITSATPTRAEITDVANAVFDGTSAIMLSGETAVGEHPAHVVKVMAKIAEQAETDAFEMDYYQEKNYVMEYDDITNAICDAACTTAKDISAKAIIAVTKSGHTARRVSKFRPKEAIIAATPTMKTYYQLALSWGVYPVLALNQSNSEALVNHAIDCARQDDLVSPGDIVVITAGVPLNVKGTTNLLKVQVVEGRA
jgi:pyruvate kinase